MGHSSKQVIELESLVEIDSGEEETLVSVGVMNLVDGWIKKVTHIVTFDSSITAVPHFGGIRITTGDTMLTENNLANSHFLHPLTTLQAADGEVLLRSSNLPSYWIYDGANNAGTIVIEKKLNKPVRAGTPITLDHMVWAQAAIAAGFITIRTIVEVLVACFVGNGYIAAENSKDAVTEYAIIIATNDISRETKWMAPCNGRLGNFRMINHIATSGRDSNWSFGRRSNVTSIETPDEIAFTGSAAFINLMGHHNDAQDQGVATNYSSMTQFVKAGEVITSDINQGNASDWFGILTWDFIPDFASKVSLAYKPEFPAAGMFGEYEIPWDMFVETIEVDWVLDSINQAEAGIISYLVLKPGTPIFDDIGSNRLGGSILGVQEATEGQMDLLPGFKGAFSFDLTDEGSSENKVESGDDIIKVYDYCPAGTMIVCQFRSTVSSVDPNITIMNIIKAENRTKHQNWGNHYFYGESILNMEDGL